MAENLVWGLVNIIYIFLGGLGIGAFFISALFILGGKVDKTRFSAARYGAFTAFIAAIAGALILPTELGHPFRAWRVFFNFAHGWQSPMFYGSWLLLLFVATSFFYALTFLPRQAAPDDAQHKTRKTLAYIGLAVGFALGIYYGVLHAAMPARPFWNTPLLPFLFLFSAYASGIGAVMLLRGLLHKNSGNAENETQYQNSGYQLLAWILALSLGQLLLLFVFIIFGTNFADASMRQAVDLIMPGGVLANDFWAWVVLVGLVVPAAIALFYMTPRLFANRAKAGAPRIAEIILPVTLLFGSYMLRYVVIVAGQMSGQTGLNFPFL
ncbi:hypothetical protein MNBD_GAMMA24-520 [hydrothermal vent metagenome]|uniref:Polysulfide reductase n=1 Tax=hydrothermal vent metagenome TaxID=652676 RepID=A0A3B1BK47_9ZZZZ